METRRYRAEDLGPLARMGMLAFGGSVAGWEKYYAESPRVDLDLVYVIEEDGGVRASAAVLPLEVFVDGEAAPMGGVAAVATHPAYRRRGYAGELMRAALWGMCERGMHLSMLNPFAHAFYRAYGWELAGEAIAYTLKPTDLPTSSEQKRVRAYEEEDLPRAMALLEEEASGYPCCVRRGEGRWREVLAREDWGAAIYEREGHREGYILYRMSDWREDREPHRTLAVQEFVWGTAAAREALISFLAAQDPLVFEIKHSTPRGEPLHPYLRSSYVKAEVEPEFMLRLVDVEGALNHLDRAANEPLVLEVSDDVIQENAAEYTVGKGEVVRGTEGRERVSLDVRRLAQLYAGYLPARQLARHGLVEPGSPRALELLELLFPVGDPWVYPADHF
ncbi:MAG: GNAT family N-acetyltransferase [Actinomycetota bacterium]|nr:GNAT family N-acetyltransferase [Actinomycetota bacterium]